MINSAFVSDSVRDYQSDRAQVAEQRLLHRFRRSQGNFAYLSPSIFILNDYLSD